MGVDCRSVSGYGIKLTEEIINKMISSGIFTKEEWEYDRESCLEKAPFSYDEAGSRYSGNVYYYLLVQGANYLQLSERVDRFIFELNKIGIHLEKKDIVKISDTLWW